MEKKTRRILLFAAVSVLTVALIATGIWWFISVQQSSTDSVDNGPAYQTVLPEETSIDQLGGWARTSPSNSDPVFAYSDTVSGVEISVNQQPLPSSFQNNVDDSIADLASSYSATTTVDASGTTAYIGTSAKGPQTVIFTKKDLLVLIKSDATITPEDWATYISSLR